jgi:hypothetical protein
MSEETIRNVLRQALDSPVEVGSYRGIDGVWAKIELDPRIENSTRPTSLSCTGTTVDEMKIRFVAATTDEETILGTLRDLEAITPADGEVSAENHTLSAGEELWPHILYEGLELPEAVQCLRAIEREPLPTY